MKKKISLLICFPIILLLILIFLIANNKNPKYIFLFIGDGMSSTQIELTEIYENSILNKETDKQEKLSFTNFDVIGLRKNYSKSSYITDSAASATALSSGIITYNGSINIDMEGNEVKPITYDLHDKGMKIGIITTMTLNHATPAAFYGTSETRHDYEKLAYDLVNSNFEYFAGGALPGIRVEELEKYDYKVINDNESLENINKKNKNIIISPYTNSDGYLNFAIDERTEFNLANYLEKGIEVLNNKNGFFIMIESGLIDIAGHSNDARSTISEVQELDEAVKVALEFAKKHPKETLIIVTGDHETGGLTLGNENNNYQLNLEILESQKYSYEKLNNYSNEIKNGDITYDRMLDYLKNNYGIKDTDLRNVYNQIKDGNDNILKETILTSINKNAGISYSSGVHTAEPIPVYAYGLGSEKFSGIYNSAEFNQKLRKITK